VGIALSSKNLCIFIQLLASLGSSELPENIYAFHWISLPVELYIELTLVLKSSINYDDANTPSRRGKGKALM
jgi:hypothetical protein